MIQLNKIYFDGKGYIQKCIDINDPQDPDLVKMCSRLNFTPVDSISFESYQPQTFCDITVGDYYIQGVSIEHLFTDIKKSTQTILYPSYNPNPDPGGLY